MKRVSRARRAAAEGVSELSEVAAMSEKEALAAAAAEEAEAAAGALADMAARREEKGRDNSRAAVISEWVIRVIRARRAAAPSG